MDVWRDRLREVNAMRGRSMRNAFVISLRQRFVFTPVSKAANSTAKALLYQAEFRHHGYIRQAERVGELPAIELHDVTTSPFPMPYQLPGGTLQAVLFSDRYYRFAFVREPVERLLSCYLDRIADIDSVARAEVETVLGKEKGRTDLAGRVPRRHRGLRSRPDEHPLAAAMAPPRAAARDL